VLHPDSWVPPNRLPYRGKGSRFSGSRHQSQHGLLSSTPPALTSLTGRRSPIRTPSWSSPLMIPWSSFQAPPVYWSGRIHFSPTSNVVDVPSEISETLTGLSPVVREAKKIGRAHV